MESSAAKELICRAIRERKLLDVVYHGRQRWVAPHILGIDTAGTEILSCYQVAGDAAGGEQRGWKSLKTRELTVRQISSMHFHPRPEYRSNDRAMVTVYCRV
jgi:hypothetical protein